MDTIVRPTSALALSFLSVFGRWCGGDDEDQKRATVAIEVSGESSGAGVVRAVFTHPDEHDSVCQKETTVLSAGGRQELTACHDASHIELRVIPANGSTFVGWGGACADAGQASTCSLHDVTKGQTHVVVGFKRDWVAKCPDLGTGTDNTESDAGHCAPSNNTLDPDHVKVFILAGQSNMVGTGTASPTQAQVAKNGGRGTLQALVTRPETAAAYAHLVTPSGDWRVREDVWLVDLQESRPLTVNGATFGPELQFGHVVGDFFDNDVVIIKIAWGGKSLAVDFRPPSSGGTVGASYVAMVERVREVLQELDNLVPGYNGRGYEISGFGWHQGWNDRVTQAFNDEYQANCVNLINDLREELGAPEMPFVLATTGMSGWHETHPRALSLMEAQMAVPTDDRLHVGRVRAVETRDFWRGQEVSPADQAYHWNRNAETYFLIGDAMANAMLEMVEDYQAVDIHSVYFAQTHVQAPGDDLLTLVSDRDMLIKAHVVSPESGPAPSVVASLNLDGEICNVCLSGPEVLPVSVSVAPGVAMHTYDDSFTAVIPAAWVQPGLSVVVHAGQQSFPVENLRIGAPTRVHMTMFDVHYFRYSEGDYPAGWREEIEAKWPVSGLDLERVPNVVFDELAIPPRPDVNAPAVRVTSREDYRQQTGLPFDGEQAAALQWKSALMAAAGTAGRTSLYYVNIYGVWAGGQAGGFGGVGNGTGHGILHHELGHALSLPHWANSSVYPYKGDMYGISAPATDSETHVGPTWAFDLPTGSFVPPTVQTNAVGGTPGTYKCDPMQGGGKGDQERGFLLRHFSDYSVHQMQSYLERHVVIWNQWLGSYAAWDQRARGYLSEVDNDGVRYPVQRRVQVISVMAGVSAASPQACIAYPPIGPYEAGMINLFDPTDANDREQAGRLLCASGGCDVTLRIHQGGSVKHAMLAIVWDPSSDPLARNSYSTRAVNVPAADGRVTRVEVLLTPDAQRVGLPDNPTVLDIYSE